MSTPIFPLRNAQAGFSLIVVLIFLVALVLLGTTGMQGAALEERMASNSRDHAFALEAAETALAAAETAAYSAAGAQYVDDCTNGLCSKGHAPDPTTFGWSGSKAKTISRATLTNKLSADLASDPAYFAEYLGDQDLGAGLNTQQVIRVTVRATGRDANTKVILQSLISRASGS